MKKLLSIIALLCVSSILFVACGSTTADSTTNTSDTMSTAAATNTNKDTYTFVIESDPLTLNPINAADRWGLTVRNLIFSPLSRVQEDGSVKNDLAEKIETSEDGLNITVTLKDNLLWSDGQPITADDVIFTYEAKIKKENGSSETLWIDDKSVSLEKIDDKTVKFILPAVNAPMLTQVPADAYIIPKHIYESITDFSQEQLPVNPVGSGPYKFVQQKKGEYLSFEANENYHDGVAKIKNLVLRVISNADTAKVALQSGEVDAGVIQASDVKDMENSGLAIYSYSEGRVGHMAVNSNAEKMKNEDLRKAIFYAINKDEMNLATYVNAEYYETAYSILPPGNPYYDDNVEKYTQDIDKAKELVKQAGAEGTEINLAYANTDKIQKLQVNFIKEALDSIGLKTNLLAVDNAALMAELKKDDSQKYDMYMNGYIWGIDPDLYATQFQTRGDFNILHYSNEEVDKFFDEGAVELDKEKRKEIYNKVQELIAEDAVFYPIVDSKKIIASNPGVKGYDEAKFFPVFIMEDWGKLSK